MAKNIGELDSDIEGIKRRLIIDDARFEKLDKRMGALEERVTKFMAKAAKAAGGTKGAGKKKTGGKRKPNPKRGKRPDAGTDTNDF
jgi:hypothetical protein